MLCLLVTAAASADTFLDEKKQSAESGDADAALTLGLMYAIGEEVTPDTQQARQWYEKSPN